MTILFSFVSALALNCLTELFKYWLGTRKQSKKHKKRHQSFKVRCWSIWLFCIKKSRHWSVCFSVAYGYISLYVKFNINAWFCQIQYLQSYRALNSHKKLCTQYNFLAFCTVIEKAVLIQVGKTMHKGSFRWETYLYNQYFKALTQFNSKKKQCIQQELF